MFVDEDKNEDGVLQLNEFESLCKKADPNIADSKVLQMFNEALENSNNKNLDSISPEAFSLVAI